jgi:hypothetical protein
MKCIIGTCPRPAVTVIENQLRCQPHAAELAPALALIREGVARDLQARRAEAQSVSRPPRRGLWTLFMPDRSQTKTD